MLDTPPASWTGLHVRTAENEGVWLKQSPSPIAPSLLFGSRCLMDSTHADGYLNRRRPSSNPVANRTTHRAARWSASASASANAAPMLLQYLAVPMTLAIITAACCCLDVSARRLSLPSAGELW